MSKENNRKLSASNYFIYTSELESIGQKTFIFHKAVIMNLCRKLIMSLIINYEIV